MTSRRNVRYTPFSADDDYDYDFANRKYDHRFDNTQKMLDKTPLKSIALALFLLFLGCNRLFFSVFKFTGHIGGEFSQAYGLLALGCLTFRPGIVASTAYQ